MDIESLKRWNLKDIHSFLEEFGWFWKNFDFFLRFLFNYFLFLSFYFYFIKTFMIGHFKIELHMTYQINVATTRQKLKLKTFLLNF